MENPIQNLDEVQSPVTNTKKVLHPNQYVLEAALRRTVYDFGEELRKAIQQPENPLHDTPLEFFNSSPKYIMIIMVLSFLILGPRWSLSLGSSTFVFYSLAAYGHSLNRDKETVTILKNLKEIDTLQRALHRRVMEIIPNQSISSDMQEDDMNNEISESLSIFNRDEITQLILAVMEERLPYLEYLPKGPYQKPDEDLQS